MAQGTSLSVIFDTWILQYIEINKYQMKINKYNTGVILVILILAAALTSCQKESGPDYKYFISGEPAVSYTKANVEDFLDLAVQPYPETAQVRPYVISGCDVYKMVYSTEINGNQIEASGLICVPSEKGKYPVLSFQNGTNTKHSDAPTEKVTDVSYTLVEMISSMGFIVVIPDYPGFGSSAQIPHPYLIAEPTVRSIVDMFKALKEAAGSEFPGISVENEYYLAGYSQGGWATLTMHKALETDYSADFNLAASACGAGSYNMYDMFTTMIGKDTYPMPAYLGYVIYAYSEYDQFTNPVEDILNKQYADKLSSLFTGTLSTGDINKQLTTSISGLFTPGFLAGFSSSSTYSSVRNALMNNSISAWKTLKPLFLAHGSSDTSVPVEATEIMYQALLEAGTSPEICKKIIFPDLEHGEGLIPSMIAGLSFLLDIRDN